MKKIDTVTEIRGFNRFYTNILGLLDKNILDSDYSLTESRIIYELSKINSISIELLGKILNLNEEYLKKIISDFKKNKIVDEENEKIFLTQNGQDLFHKLEKDANLQISKFIEPLSDIERQEICKSMAILKKYFTKVTVKLEIRTFNSEDINYIIDRQLSLYESERKFTSDIWKNYLIEGVQTMLKNFDAEKDCIFILESNKVPSACIAIMHTENNNVQLRYFFVEPELRGIGAGKILLNKAVNYCKEKKYSKIFLWTVSAQETARKMYKSAGFELTETHKDESWGVPVVEEKWEMNIF